MVELFEGAVGKIAFTGIMVIIAYLAVCLVMGFKTAGNIKNIREFALGDGKISTPALVTTIFATYLGAGATFGIIEKVNTAGILFAIAAFVGPIRWWFNSIICGRNIEQFKGCLGMGGIMFRLYGRPGKIISNAAIIIDAIGTVAVQSLALGYMMHYFLELSIEQGIVLGIGTLVIYSLMGGIKAVMMTDSLQFVLFYILLPVLCVIMVQKFGGLEAIHANISGEKWVVVWDLHSVQVLFGFMVYSVLSNGFCDPNFIQRFLISGNASQVIKALKVVSLIELSVVSMLVILGIVVAVHGTQETNAVTILYEIFHLHLSKFLCGAMLIGIMAIIMSTADSSLNNAAVVVAHDIFRSLYSKMSDNMEVMIARIATITIGLVSVLIALHSSGIIDLMWKLLNFYAPVILTPLIAGFLYFRTNVTSFVISIIFAISGTLLGAYFERSFDLVSLTIGCSGSAIGLFGTHHLQKSLGILRHVAKHEKAALENMEQENASREKRIPKAIEEMWPIKRPLIAKHELNLNIAETIVRWLKVAAALRFKDIITFCNHGVKLCPPKYYWFSTLGFFCCLFPVLSQTELCLEEQSMLTIELVLKIVGAAGCVVIVLLRVQPSKTVEKYLPLLWYTALLFCLPTLSTYSYIVDHTRMGAIIGLLMSMLTLAIFVDWLSFCVLSALGFVMGHLLYAACALSVGAALESFSGFFEIVSIYLVVAFAIVATTRYMAEKEVKIMKIFGGAVAHEVRSPMASAYSGIGVLSDVIRRTTSIPTANQVLLDDGVMTINNKNSKLLIMKNSDYDLIKDISESMKGILMQGMQSAESILMAMSNANNDNETGEYSALKAAKEAVKTHHMEPEELARVHVLESSKDFNFFGSYKLFRHVIHNLLANALKYAGPTAQISIWTEDRTLYFRDSGQGIDPKSISHIFDLFYTKNGSGLGLAFCKTVITNMGGTISCRSELGKYTEFEITLPKHKEEEQVAACF